MFTIQTGVEKFRIVGPEGEDSDQVSDAVEYGEVAVLKIDEAIYYACIEDADAEDAAVMQVNSVKKQATEIEEVIFDGEEAEEETEVDEEDDDEEDDEDEEGGDQPELTAV